MPATATHNVAVRTGEYTDRQSGELKSRWLNIGTIFTHENGGKSLKINCIPAGLPDWQGFASIFPIDQPQQQRAPQGATPARTQPAARMQAPQRGPQNYAYQQPNGAGLVDDMDDIPF